MGICALALDASAGLLLIVPGGRMALGVLGAGAAEGWAGPWGQRQAGFLPSLVEEALHVVAHVAAQPTMMLSF